MIEESKLPLTLRDYSFIKLIGKGGTASVFLVESMKFGQYFVAKVIDVPNSKSAPKWRPVSAEISALSILSHNNIIRLYDYFQEGSQFIMILEYCENGSLAQVIPPNSGLSLNQFKQNAFQITEALNFCHMKSIAHRDLKPSNIFVDSYQRMKLADFGLSICAPHCAKEIGSFCGSFIYTAPEVLKMKPHSPFKSDIWSLGVTFFVMLTGHSPFFGSSMDEIKEKIYNGEMNITEDDINKIPTDILDLIKKMVVVDPTKRLEINEVLADPLFADFNIKRRKFIPQIPTLHRKSLGKEVCSNIQLGETAKRETHACSSFMTHGILAKKFTEKTPSRRLSSAATFIMSD